MGYDKEQSFGVEKVNMRTFYKRLATQLYLLTGLKRARGNLKLSQMRHPCLALGAPGVGKTAGVIALVESVKRELETKEMEAQDYGEAGGDRQITGQELKEWLKSQGIPQSIEARVNLNSWAGEEIDSRAMIDGLISSGVSTDEAREAVRDKFKTVRAELSKCGLRDEWLDLAVSYLKPARIGFRKIMLAQKTPGSFEGIITVNQRTGTTRREILPELPTDADEKYGVLFLDEATTASVEQLQPALGLSDSSRNIGSYTLPPHWLVVFAGNGPEFANFRSFDDMAKNRVKIFDIQYDYEEDWRRWAVANSINAGIVGFLDFFPDCVIKIETDTDDEAGKQFASPRSWEMLSDELALADAVGASVSGSEIYTFASGIIGTPMARKFAGFVLCCQGLKVKPGDVLSGKVKSVKDLGKETANKLFSENDALKDMSVPVQLQGVEGLYTMLLNGVITALEAEMAAMPDTVTGEALYEQNGKLTQLGQRAVNTLRFILSGKTQFLDRVLSSIVLLTTKLLGFPIYDMDSACSTACPEYLDFVTEYQDSILSLSDKGFLN